MEKQNMTQKSIEILKQAYLYRQDGFQNERFTELYLDWCKSTGYEDTDGENFRVYVKIYGEQAKVGSASFVSSNPNSRARARGTNRMIMTKSDESSCDTAMVEKHRREIMRRFVHAQYC